jgi:hypothetical protein
VSVKLVQEIDIITIAEAEVVLLLDMNHGAIIVKSMKRLVG